MTYLSNQYQVHMMNNRPADAEKCKPSRYLSSMVSCYNAGTVNGSVNEAGIAVWNATTKEHNPYVALISQGYTIHYINSATQDSTTTIPTAETLGRIGNCYYLIDGDLVGIKFESASTATMGNPTSVGESQTEYNVSYTLETLKYVSNCSSFGADMLLDVAGNVNNGGAYYDFTNADSMTLTSFAVGEKLVDVMQRATDAFDAVNIVVPYLFSIDYENRIG